MAQCLCDNKKKEIFLVKKGSRKRRNGTIELVVSKDLYRPLTQQEIEKLRVAKEIKSTNFADNTFIQRVIANQGKSYVSFTDFDNPRKNEWDFD